MRRVIMFGGSGGLGTELRKLMAKYEVRSLSSRDVDVTDFASVDRACSEFKPEVTINLSGCNFDSFLHKLDAESAAQANRIVGVNAIGAMNVTACSLRHMRAAGYGRIILVSSVLSRKVVLGTGAYSATKAFIDSLVRTASAENCGKGVTCNSIRLGYFDGGMCHRMPPAVQDAVRASIPTKRWGRIDELLSTIEYLIATEYVTGQNTEVSGGIQ